MEHYLYDWGGACPNPCVFLAAAAAITTRIRLTTGAVLPAFRHPVQLASELAMLDQLSGGRLDVGFARGFLPGEFELFGVPMGESRQRFEAGLAVALLLGLLKDGFALGTPIGMHMEIMVLAFLVTFRLSRRLALRSPLGVVLLTILFSLGCGVVELLLSLAGA